MMKTGVDSVLEFGAHEVFGPWCTRSLWTLVQVESMDLGAYEVLGFVADEVLGFGADEDGKVQIMQSTRSILH